MTAGEVLAAARALVAGDKGLVARQLVTLALAALGDDAGPFSGTRWKVSVACAGQPA